MQKEYNIPLNQSKNTSIRESTKQLSCLNRLKNVAGLCRWANGQNLENINKIWLMVVSCYLRLWLYCIYTFRTSSSKHRSTLLRVFALHSRNKHPYSLAKSIPSSFVTALAFNWWKSQRNFSTSVNERAELASLSASVTGSNPSEGAAAELPGRSKRADMGSERKRRLLLVLFLFQTSHGIEAACAFFASIARRLGHWEIRGRREGMALQVLMVFAVAVAATLCCTLEFSHSFKIREKVSFRGRLSIQSFGASTAFHPSSQQILRLNVLHHTTQFLYIYISNT